MKVLVTGGLGFIGSEFIRQTGPSVTKISCLDLKDQLKFVTSKERSEIFRNRMFQQVLPKIHNIFYGPFGKLTLHEITSLIDSHDVIVHLGATVHTNLSDNDDNCFENNFLETQLLSAVAKQQGKPVVFASSASVYGNGSGPLCRYAVSKLMAENDVSKLQNSAILRFFNVYGPFEEHKGPMASMVYQIYKNIYNNNKFKLWMPDAKRDFISVYDVAQIIWAAVYKLQRKSNKNYILDVGTGTARSFKEIAMIIDNHLSDRAEFPIRTLPYEVIDIPQNLRGQYQIDTCAKLGEYNNFGIKPVDLETGIRNLIITYDRAGY